MSKIAFIASIFDKDVNLIQQQLKSKNITNIDVFPHGSKPTGYDIIEYNVRPNKTHGEILDLGLNFVKFGFHSDEFSPLNRTGSIEQDKILKLKVESDNEIKHLSDSLTDELEEFDFSKYTLRIKALAKKDEELRKKSSDISTWTMANLANAYDYTDDIIVLISIGAEIYTRKFGKPISKAGHEYNYDPTWIASDFLESIKQYPDQKRKWIKAYKTRARNIIKQEKNFNSLKFFAKFLVEKHEDQLEYTIDYESIASESNQLTKQSTYGDSSIDIEESDIPF